MSKKEITVKLSPFELKKLVTACFLVGLDCKSVKAREMWQNIRRTLQKALDEEDGENQAE